MLPIGYVSVRWTLEVREMESVGVRKMCPTGKTFVTKIGERTYWYTMNQRSESKRLRKWFRVIDPFYRGLGGYR